MDQSHDYHSPDPTKDVTEALLPATASPDRPVRRWSRAALILVIIGFIAVAAGVVTLVMLNRAAKMESQAASTSTPKTTSAAVQTDDLAGDLDTAGTSVSQSQSDQQSVDSSLNDANSQVAVPTE